MAAQPPGSQNGRIIYALLCVPERCACGHAGYYNTDQTSQYQTFTDQWQHYRQAYDVAALSLQQGRGLKGVMFWHWAGVDDNAPNGEGSTICAPSAQFVTTRITCLGLEIIEVSGIRLHGIRHGARSCSGALPAPA